MRSNKPWIIASVAMICLIWDNSLVPGSGSGSLSLAVMNAIHGFLGALGLPYSWVTNFVVRKCAHFTEYAILGVLVTHAVDIDRKHRPLAVALAVIVLVAVPSIDETIQTHVAGRCGQVSDVILDCCGAFTGSLLRYWFGWVRCRKKFPANSIFRK